MRMQAECRRTWFARARLLSGGDLPVLLSTASTSCCRASFASPHRRHTSCPKALKFTAGARFADAWPKGCVETTSDEGEEDLPWPAATCRPRTLRLLTATRCLNSKPSEQCRLEGCRVACIQQTGRTLPYVAICPHFVRLARISRGNTSLCLSSRC